MEAKEEIIEEKDSIVDKDSFIGAIRMKFKPNLPKKSKMSLKVFSFSMPEHTTDGSYTYLMSWYDEHNRNVNTIGDGD